MTVDIFIRSYRGDFHWLEYCLKSIKKYAHGFNKVHLCIPKNDITALPAGNEVVHLVNGWDDDYIGQQNDKLFCDHFCGSPYALVLDSDCILVRDLKPEDLFIEGRPVWLYESVPDGSSPWPAIVEEAIGWKPDFDFMRRHPFVMPRQELRDFRQFMFNKHGEALNVWLKKRPYRRFTEYNSFGAWAYKEKYGSFTWMSPGEFPTYVRQFWSWGGLTKEIEREIDILLA
jgi:hypothetical protein